jgi:hypothetical protein
MMPADKSRQVSFGLRYQASFDGLEQLKTSLRQEIELLFVSKISKRRSYPGIMILGTIICLISSRSFGGLTWPTNQFLPTFSAPTILECIDVSSASGAEQNLFASLEGIVNRAQPRIACVSSGNQEGEFTWLNLHDLAYGVVVGYKTHKQN